METPVQDAKPELRPKRPVYQSYGDIIKTITAAANKRIKADRNPDAPTIEKVTVGMRGLQRTIVALRKKLKAAERKLSDEHKAEVEHDGKLGLTYSEARRLRELPERNFQSRLSVVRQLSIRATLDTVDMTPTQAKKYLIDLERRLSTI